MSFQGNGIAVGARKYNVFSSRAPQRVPVSSASANHQTTEGKIYNDNCLCDIDSDMRGGTSWKDKSAIGTKQYNEGRRAATSN